MRKWLADEKYNKPVEDALFGEASQKLFDQDAVRDLWNRFIGGEALLWNRVYAVYVFLLWYEMKF